jgi:phenolic acid decarboxylase
MRFSLSDTGLDVSVPSVFPSKAIDSVLLTADEVNTTPETYAMSGNERKGVMKVDRSTYGMYASSVVEMQRRLTRHACLL